MCVIYLNTTCAKRSYSLKKKDRYSSQWRIQYDNLTKHVQLKVFKNIDISCVSL